MAREMKDSGIEWIGEIPKHWNKTTIKNGCDLLSSGTTPASGHEEYYLNGTINWIQSGDLYNNPIISSVSKRITQKAFDNTPSLKVYIAPFIVVAMYGASVGNVSISEIDACCNQACCCIKTNEKLSLKFLMYWLVSCKKDFLVKASGGGQPNISQQIIQNEVLLIPSKEEQQRIASFLDSKCAEIDKAVEATKASIEEYRKLRQAIITEAVTKGLDPDVEMKDSGIEWIGKIPISWTINTLGRLSSSMRNGYVGPTKEILRESGVRYIQSLHVKDGQILYSDDFYVSEEWGNNHPKIHTNDILIVQTGDIGQVGLVTNDYNECNCHALIICTPKQTIISSAYLCYYFRSSFGLRQLKQFETGATLKHLNSGDIKFSKVILPSLDEQIEICSYLDSKCSEIDSLIKSKEKLIEELTAYRKSLIFEYVTGKKEVPAV